jgi:hypothetical protein
MADSTNPLPSVKEPFVDRYRFINPVWLRWLKPLLETVKSTATRVETVTTTVNDLTTTVTETATSVAGLSGQWGVAIDVNGKVIGLVRLDGGATGSTFTVVADKFFIKHPTTTDEIEVFVVGQVAGINTVGINGELMVDGTITADALNLNTLSEATPDAGVIVNGTLKDSADVYEFRIADGYWGATDGSNYINMKTGVINFTS